MVNPTLRTLFAALAVLTVLLAAPRAEAVVVTWNTCAAHHDGRCAIGPAASARATAGAVSDTAFGFEGLGEPTRLLAARAFAGADDLGAVGAAAIDVFHGGLGVRAPGGPNGAPNHAVGDIGPDRLIVFEFANDAYVPLGFRIGWRGGDADIVTFIGGTLGGFGDALGAFLGGGVAWDGGKGLIDGFGFAAQTFDDVFVGEDNRFDQGASGRHLIIAARNQVRYATQTERLTVFGLTREDCGEETFFGGYDFTYLASRQRCGYKLDTIVALDAGDDAFQVSQIVGETADTSAPEPGSIVLLGFGLAAIVVTRRRAVFA